MKGFFTQGAIVLTDGALSIDAMNRALARFDVARFTPAEQRPGWMGGQPTWLVPYRPEVNGYVLVEAFDVPWPDHMGDPQGAGGTENPMGEVMLFGAWSMGIMGPHTYPGNLARAINAAQRMDRDDVASAAQRHSGFVRIKSSYVLGAQDNSKVAPDDYGVRAELEFVTSIAIAIAHAPAALCYFNPAGETLFPAADLADLIERCRQKSLPALPAWTNVRAARLEDAPGWGVGDVVGMEQLDATDHEAVFEKDRFDLNEVLSFLRDLSLYTLRHSDAIETGHTTDGPGGLWRAVLVEESLLPAPRPVIRWYADTGPRPPSKYLPAKAAASGRTKSSSGSFVNRIKSLFGR